MSIHNFGLPFQFRYRTGDDGKRRSKGNTRIVQVMPYIADVGQERWYRKFCSSRQLDFNYVDWAYEPRMPLYFVVGDLVMVCGT